MCFLLGVAAVPAQNAPENGSDLAQRSMAGDRDAMKRIIRRMLFNYFSALPDPTPYLPPQADQVDLVIEMIAEETHGQDDEYVKDRAIVWLSQQKDERVGPELEKIAMNSKEPCEYRFSAMYALAWATRTEASRVFATLASDPDPIVRGRVLSACSVWPDPEAEKILQRFTEDTDWSVRATATGKLQYWREKTAPRIGKKGSTELSTPKEGGNLQPVPGVTASPNGVTPPPRRDFKKSVARSSPGASWLRWAAAAVLSILGLAVVVVFVRRMRSAA